MQKSMRGHTTYLSLGAGMLPPVACVWVCNYSVHQLPDKHAMLPNELMIEHVVTEHVVTESQMALCESLH